jgi:DNA-binding winged helix-turn-helix (wHTH) protein
MTDGDKHYLGTACFDPVACEIFYQGRVVHLQPQVRSVLLCLVKHSPDIVERQTFFEEAWNAKLVSDESLTRCISVLRKNLNNYECPFLIETIPKVGYRLKIKKGEIKEIPLKEKGSIQDKLRIFHIPSFLLLIIFFIFVALAAFQLS